MFLFVQSWDILRGKEAEYTDFVLRTHLPALQRIGLNVIGGFHTVVGSGPRISHVIATEDFHSLQMALDRDDFLEVTKKLQQYTVNYRSRIFKHTNRIKEGSYTIELGTWRFNQYYTLINGSEKEYEGFLREECLPALLKEGIRIKAEWQGIVGPGPYRILLEGVAKSIHDIARALVSDSFGHIKQRLLSSYVRQYSNGILAPTGRVELAFILGEMTKSL
ncbi:MAG: hypothetical protein A4E57_04565 [Syntrophorhabdaceae bacterium PtaU1.Bin034]|nr:MAG: hypothetical protein A4E57_04565 [Syntrophorhabdaceae bacterium PtaU1.Bin034]